MNRMHDGVNIGWKRDSYQARATTEVHDHVLHNYTDYVVFVIVWRPATVHAAAACVQRSYLTMSYVIAILAQDADPIL